jgi:hypothetical protein
MIWTKREGGRMMGKEKEGGRGREKREDRE